MKFITTAFVLLITVTSVAQCEDAFIADPGFEDNFLAPANEFTELGYWYQNDGAEISTNEAYSGDHALCSNGGGAEQFVMVEANTEYYISCWVSNAANDDYVRFIIDFSYTDAFDIPTNDWTFISHSFTTGEDSIFNVGIYSMGACFDDFQMTCEPLTLDLQEENKLPPYTIINSVYSPGIRLECKESLSLLLFDITGRLILDKDITPGTHIIEDGLASGIYTLLLSADNRHWSNKVYLR